MTNGTTSQARTAGTGSDHATTDQVARKAHETIDRVAERSGDAEASIREQAGTAADKLRETEERARHAAERSAERAKGFIQDKPLVSAGIAFAAGILLSGLLRR
jgi:ElaB/YqjD/DUF883 family membrane-anchored ribosome-binding protein